MNLLELRKHMQSKSSRERAKSSLRFFKIDKGDYGEGDCFLGITVPELRKLAKGAIDLDFPSLKNLLHSKWHEERFVGVVILVYQFSRRISEPHEQKKIYDFYLSHLKQVNNWDLVDVSADKIIGAYSFHHMKRASTKKILNRMVRSHDLWERRIAVLTCYYYIRQKDFAFIILVAKKLIRDEHDLIHKAVGWMLREVGKRDKAILVEFLNKYGKQMPRTMLRYAIEKFSPKERKKILLLSLR